MTTYKNNQWFSTLERKPTKIAKNDHTKLEIKEKLKISLTLYQIPIESGRSTLGYYDDLISKAERIKTSRLRRRSVCTVYTSDLGDVALNLAQTENVLRGENWSFVDEGVVNVRRVIGHHDETHRTVVNAQMTQVYVDWPRPLQRHQHTHQQNYLQIK